MTSLGVDTRIALLATVKLLRSLVNGFRGQNGHTGHTGHTGDIGNNRNTQIGSQLLHTFVELIQPLHQLNVVDEPGFAPIVVAHSLRRAALERLGMEPGRTIGLGNSLLLFAVGVRVPLECALGGPEGHLHVGKINLKGLCRPRGFVIGLAGNGWWWW